MNKDYNKHKNIAIAVLTIIATILAACAYSTDSVIYVDNNGNIIKSTLK